MQKLSNMLVICFAIGIDGFSPLPFAPIHSLYGRSSGVRIHQAIGKQAVIRLRLPQPIGLCASFVGSEDRMKGSGKGGLVTEADVEAAVINAEKKWEKALEVRRQADELSSQAEEAAAQSQTVSQEAAKKIDENTTFSLKMVAQGHKVQNASMKAAELLAQAADLSQEADLLELEAEGALLDSERAIEQHLVDFPADNQDSQDS